MKRRILIRLLVWLEGTVFTLREKLGFCVCSYLEDEEKPCDVCWEARKKFNDRREAMKNAPVLRVRTHEEFKAALNTPGPRLIVFDYAAQNPIKLPEDDPTPQ